MCDCVSKINAMLLEKGHNTRIKTPLTLNPDLSNAGQKLEIVTEKADRNIRKKPVAMFSSFCPFCGEKHQVA